MIWDFFDMEQYEFATNVVASGLLTAEEIVSNLQSV